MKATVPASSRPGRASAAKTTRWPTASSASRAVGTVAVQLELAVVYDAEHRRRVAHVLDVVADADVALGDDAVDRGAQQRLGEARLGHLELGACGAERGARGLVGGRRFVHALLRGEPGRLELHRARELAAGARGRGLGLQGGSASRLHAGLDLARFETGERARRRALATHWVTKISATVPLYSLRTSASRTAASVPTTSTDCSRSAVPGGRHLDRERRPAGGLGRGGAATAVSCAGGDEEEDQGIRTVMTGSPCGGRPARPDRGRGGRERAPTRPCRGRDRGARA